MRKLTLGAIALAAGTTIGSTASHATFTVDIFTNQPIGVITNVSTFAGGAIAGTFTVNAINFNSDTAANVGTFIASCPVASCNPQGFDAADMAQPLQNTVLRFQARDGNATVTQNPNPAIPGSGAIAPGEVVVRHDDGFVLDDGIVAVPTPPFILADPIASSAHLDRTLTFGTAPRAATLFYAEGFGGPANLQTNLVNAAAAVPEPASLALLGSALVGLGVMMRRRRKTG